MAAMQRVTLAGEVDLDGFRVAARRLLLQGVPPDDVAWAVAGAAGGDLLAGGDDTPAEPDVPERPASPEMAGSKASPAVDTSADAPADAVAGAPRGAPADALAGAPLDPPAGPALRVPREFLELCSQVVQHAEPTRFHRLYRLLWRLQREPALRDDALDPELAEARRMAQAVRREQHKMKAFVRFREVHEPGAAPGAAPLHVAWFEPAHHVVEAVAPFFMRRFAGMRFAILTPRRSVRWDGHTLQLGAGAGRQHAPPADAGEALWLTYYASIFNPARLKLRAMEKEMPRRYWHNLPEATLISGLAASAQERSQRMVEQPGTVPLRKLPALASVRGEQLPPGAPRPATGEHALQPPGSSKGSQPPSGDAALPLADAPAGESTPGPRDPAAAPTLHRLQQAAAGCRNCPLGALATQTVFGEGAAGAALMLVGEQPGDQEDLQGRPFVGPAGQLLARAMVRLGWPREGVYITNAVKHFKYTPQLTPRGKRRIHKTPAQREADACLPWLEREIGLVGPQAIVALGATAARQLLGRPVAVLRERGQWFTREDGVPVLVTLHPSALLRMDLEREARDQAFEDWVADLERASRYARQPGAGGAAAHGAETGDRGPGSAPAASDATDPDGAAGTASRPPAALR